MPQIPWVSRRAEAHRFGSAIEAEFGGVAAAGDDDAGRQQALGQRAVVVGDKTVEQTAAVGDGHAGIGLIKILQQVGGARQRSGRQAARELAASLIVHALDHGIDLRVPTLDALDGRIQHFAWRDRAPGDEPGKTHHVVGFVVLKCHCASSHLFKPSAKIEERPNMPFVVRRDAGSANC